MEKDWFNRGRLIEINGRKLFVIDSGLGLGLDSRSGSENKPVLCILHGFPTSSFDYHKVFDRLAEKYRVIIHDHLGFGFSDKPVDYSYSLMDQTDIALALWQSLNLSSATILAHDYGTSVLTEILARDNQGECPLNIEKIILCNGSMHIEMAQLRLMQKLLRNRWIGSWIAKLSSKKTLIRNLKKIYFDPDKLDPKEVDAIWSMMSNNHGRKVLAKVSRYTFERSQYWDRWIGALQKTELPIHIIWPKNDPICINQMAELIHQETKNSELNWIKNTGHFPMLESPNQWSELVLSIN